MNFDIISICSLFVGVIGIIFGVFIALRNRQVYKPILRFSPGITYVKAPKYRRILLKKPISTIIFGASLSPKCHGYFALPFCLENTSKLSIHDIRLSLHYSSKHLLTERMVQREFGQKVEIFPENIQRQTTVYGEVGHVTYDFPIMRPGEKFVLADPLKVSFLKDVTKEISDGKKEASFFERMKKIEHLVAFFPVDIFLYSENCPPQSHRINVMCFNIDSLDELQKMSSPILDAFWGGKYPRAGIYLIPPWKKFIKSEFGEIIIPELHKVRGKTSQHIFVENPLESSGAFIDMPLPAWDYYTESGPDVEPYYDPFLSAILSRIRKLRAKKSIKR